uniref:Mediator of RNA polymerase II transcription subunit 29 n=1 Tax=Lygus hesperus TaxID=30085 RepID=A0A0A9WP58_LYGHE
MMQMGGMGPGGPPMAPQMPPQNVVQPPMVGPPQPPQQAQEKLDNISKVKSLIGPLTNSLSTTLKTAAHNLHQNALVDIGTSKNIDILPPRFDKSLEEFYSICDQIELHLKTSIECLNQGKSNQTYLNLTVMPTRSEPMPNQDMNALTYPQYLSTVRTQVNFAKELHDMLLAAAQNITSSD